MNKILTLFLFSISFFLDAQDTFSIVAIDNETGEIGSAGATCLDDDDIAGGAIIISDIVVGKGAVHTQSFYHPTNQSIANGLLKDGNNAQQIIDGLILNDVESNPSVRQYGVVTFAGLPGSNAAAFTGDNCFDVKHQKVGPFVSVQGNILLNEGIVDSMISKFNTTDGPLHAKLMAAMQGANVPGADSRCLSEGVSSLSAFLRVAKPDDSNDSLWMDLLVSKTPFGVEPIDRLQALYDDFLLTSKTSEQETNFLELSPNPSQGIINLKYEFKRNMILVVTDMLGKEISIEKFEKDQKDSTIFIINKGINNISILNESGKILVTKQVIIH